MFFDLFRRRTQPAERIERVVGSGHVLVADGECVDDADSYRAVVEDLCRLTDGALRFDEVDCVERDGFRELTLRRGDRVWRALLEGQTDWVDPDPLLAVLNEAVAELGAEHRLSTFDPKKGHAAGYVWLSPDQARELATDPSGPSIVSRPWDPPGWRQTPLQAHRAQGEILAVAVSPDGRIVASSAGSQVLRFDLQTLTELDPIHVDHPRGLGFDAQGRLMIGTLRGLIRADDRLGDRVVVGVAFDATRTRMAVAALEHPDLEPPAWVELWDLRTNRKLAEWPFDVGMLHVALAPDGQRVAAVSETGRMGLWTDRGVTIGEREWDGCLWGVAFRADGTELAVGPESGPVALVSPMSAGVVGTVAGTSGAWGLAYGPDGALAIAGRRGIEVVRDGAAEAVWSTPDPTGGVTAVGWLPDGALVGGWNPGRGRLQVSRWR